MARVHPREMVARRARMAFQDAYGEFIGFVTYGAEVRVLGALLLDGDAPLLLEDDEGRALLEKVLPAWRALRGQVTPAESWRVVADCLAYAAKYAVREERDDALDGAS